MEPENNEDKRKRSHDEVAVELQAFEKIDKDLLSELDISSEERMRLEKNLVWKLDMRLLPLMMLICESVDFVCLGHTTLKGRFDMMFRCLELFGP